MGLDGESNGGRWCIGIVLCLIHGSDYPSSVSGTIVAKTRLGGC